MIEVALCGHATLASAHALWEEGVLAASVTARLPPHDSTSIRARATVTLVVISVPNFNGMRVLIGKKYSATFLTRTSLNLLIREVVLMNKERRARRCRRDRRAIHKKVRRHVPTLAAHATSFCPSARPNRELMCNAPSR